MENNKIGWLVELIHTRLAKTTLLFMALILSANTPVQASTAFMIVNEFTDAVDEKDIELLKGCNVPIAGENLKEILRSKQFHHTRYVAYFF